MKARQVWVCVRRGLLVALTTCCACFQSCERVPNQDFGPPRDLAVPDLLRILGSSCSAQEPCGVGACCKDVCVDLERDPQNCGFCGNACPSQACRWDGDGGVAHCGCDGDPDAGACPALEPSCGANGVCTCGGHEAQQCSPPLDDRCQSNACTCAGQACDPKLADHCDATSSPPCRCGTDPSCPGDRADRCSGSCKCGDVAACATGQFCCDQGAFNSHCCQSAQYCCLDGCCNNPCLLFGFCNH